MRLNNNDFSLSNIFALEGKVAVIIGGGGYLCSTMAKGLAAAGVDIIILDVRLHKAIEIISQINDNYSGDHMALEVNASNKESHECAKQKIISKYGNIDILINGAGTNSPTPFFDIELEDWNKVMDSQLLATMLGCQVFGAQMVRQKNGSIINISSASAGPPLSKAYAYSAAKAGIRNLTMNLGREWALEGVRVNCIRPGFFPTEWNKKNFISPEREKAILSHTPMARYGDPKELLGATLWLASNASSFVTGSEVTIDGGFSCMTI